jgi:LPS export ABC transporter protein LptC
MKKILKNILSIAMVFMAMLFWSCSDTYKRVGAEAQKKIFPQGIGENFVLTYTEMRESLKSEDSQSSKVISVLSSPISEDFTNLTFPYRTFPNGLVLDIYDAENRKSVISADYGIIYSATNLIDLQGNVVVDGYDGKKLESPQLFYDQTNEWIFTQKKFKYTNPEEGTIMDGEGMDLKYDKSLSYVSAHKTYGLMLIKDEGLNEQDNE